MNKLSIAGNLSAGIVSIYLAFYLIFNWKVIDYSDIVIRNSNGTYFTIFGEKFYLIAWLIFILVIILFNFIHKIPSKYYNYPLNQITITADNIDRVIHYIRGMEGLLNIMNSLIFFAIIFPYYKFSGKPETYSPISTIVISFLGTTALIVYAVRFDENKFK